MNQPNQDLKVLLAQYMGQQPQSRQTTHKWMNRLTAASPIVVAGALLWAIYVSTNPTHGGLFPVPYWWMAFVVSMALPFFLIGLTAAVVQAFPPANLTGFRGPFLTGRQGAWGGVFLMIGTLVGAALLVTLLYTMFTDPALPGILIPLIVSLSLIVALLGIVVTVFRLVMRSR